MTSNFFMQMFNVSTLCMQSINDFSKSSGTSWFPCACTIWALTLIRKQSVKKLPKFKTLWFCQKVFVWHQTSWCKCSMCLHFAWKVSDGFSKSSGTSWFPRACTIWALTKSFLSSKVLKKMAKFKMLSFCQKVPFMASNFFKQMFNVSTLCMQNIRWLQQKLWYKLSSPCMHYLSTHKPSLRSKVSKKARFKMLSICQKVFLWHQTSSWKCSMCLYFVRKVTDSVFKCSGRSWFPRTCTI